MDLYTAKPLHWMVPSKEPSCYIGPLLPFLGDSRKMTDDLSDCDKPTYNFDVIILIDCLAALLWAINLFGGNRFAIPIYYGIHKGVLARWNRHRTRR